MLSAKPRHNSRARTGDSPPRPDLIALLVYLANYLKIAPSCPRLSVQRLAPLHLAELVSTIRLSTSMSTTQSTRFRLTKIARTLRASAGHPQQRNRTNGTLPAISILNRSNFPVSMPTWAAAMNESRLSENALACWQPPRSFPRIKAR